jgi:hypothetical protein
MRYTADLRNSFMVVDGFGERFGSNRVMKASEVHRIIAWPENEGIVVGKPWEPCQCWGVFLNIRQNGSFCLLIKPIS